MSKNFPVLLVKMLHEKGVDAFGQYVTQAMELLDYIEKKRKEASEFYDQSVGKVFSVSKDDYVDMLVGQEIKTLLANAQPEEVYVRQKANSSKQANLSKKSKAKYRFPDEKGQYQTWSGQGKKPVALQHLIDNGESLEIFLIPADNPLLDA